MNTKRTTMQGSAGRKPREKSGTARAVDGQKAGAADRLDAILRVIEEDIIEGRMLPGQRLDERTLASRFGLSMNLYALRQIPCRHLPRCCC